MIAERGWRELRRVPPRLLFIAAIVAIPVGRGWYAADAALDARYERRCIESADDIDLCYSGYAGWARKRCDWPRMEVPPGFVPPPGSNGSECVKAWLAHGK